MPDYTGNLNLAKPIPNEDSADIRVINENMDKIDEWSTEINKKTKRATSEVEGIVKYGTDVSTALEGSKLAEILGIEYGGVLNNNNQKVAGKGYYDTANKKIYKCTTNTSINYADAGYFIEVSNNDLLGKLQNLIQIKPRDYLIGNICIEYFSIAGAAGLYTKQLTNKFKEINLVSLNGLANEEQIDIGFSQHWLVYSYDEIAMNRAIKLRKMSTQTIVGAVIGIL